MATVTLLLSDKRSGSTILQDELCKHSGIAHVEYSPHTYFETHHWLKAAVMLDRPGHLFSAGRSYQGYGTPANARAYMEEMIVKNVPDFKVPEDNHALIFDGWEALCKRFANPVFFEKSPQFLAEWSSLHLLVDWMQKTEFDVRIIGLVRNPLAVQFSAHELFSTEAESRQFGWLAIQRNLLALQAMVPTNAFRLVRYEDIIADPVGQLGELCAYLGVAPEPHIGASVHSSSKEKWRENPNYTLQLDPAVAQIAKTFGYSDQELSNPHKPDPKAIAAMRPDVQKRLRNKMTVLRDRLIRPAYLRMKAARGKDK